VGGKLDEQSSEIALFEEPGTSVAEGGKLEHGSDSQELVFDRHAEGSAEDPYLIAHRPSSRAFDESTLDVLPDPRFGDPGDSRLRSEEPFDMIERLLSSTKRAVVLPLVMTL
jgi:hypothetical protein